MTIQDALMCFALSYLGCFLIFLPKLWIRKFKELKEVSIVLAIICVIPTSFVYMKKSNTNNPSNTTKSTESATTSR